jgi:hypothetical protein
MGVHYHVFMGAANAAPMATAQIEDYDESIKQFLRLSKSVFGDNEYWAKDLSYGNLLVLSNFGDGGPMTLGTSGLCVQWTPCRNPCMSPSWN